MVLDSIPNFNIIPFLPNYLEGLFFLLSSKQENVRKTAYNFIKDLLGEVLAAIHGEIDLLFVIETMARYAGNSNEVVRSEAILWTSELLEKSDKILFKIFPSVLKVTLKCLADSLSSISEKATKVNSKLIKFFTTTRETQIMQFQDIVEVLMQFMDHESKTTRQAILDWIIILQEINPESIESKLGVLLDTLSSRIKDPEETILDSVLQVMCKIAEYQGYFHKVMEMIFKLFSQDFLILEKKGAAIITFLCNNLGTVIVYKCFAMILSMNNNQDFTKKMIAMLNELILTGPGLENLRERLKNCLMNEDNECIEFFEILFKA